MSETLKFVLVCLGVVAALIALSSAFERFFCRERKKLNSAKYISTVAICSALATLLMLIEVPLLFLAPGFYKLDLSELPVMICGLYLGPTAAVLAEFLKILLKLVLKGTTTAYVGELANFVVGCSLVLPAVAIYHTKKTKKNAVLGLCGGTVFVTVFGSFFNAVYLLPAFAELFGMPIDSIIAAGTAINGSITNVATFVLLAVAPLNLIKGVAVSVLTMLLYKRTEKILFHRI